MYKYTHWLKRVKRLFSYQVKKLLAEISSSEAWLRIKELFLERCGFDDTTRIAEALGYKYQSVYKWEKSGQIPSIESLAKIALLTNGSIHWILTGQGPRYTPDKSALVIPLDANEKALLQRKASEQQTTPEAWARGVLQQSLNQLEVLPYPLPGEVVVDLPIYEANLEEIPNERLGSAFKSWLEDLKRRASV